MLAGIFWALFIAGGALIVWFGHNEFDHHFLTGAVLGLGALLLLTYLYFRPPPDVAIMPARPGKKESGDWLDQKMMESRAGEVDGGRD